MELHHSNLKSHPLQVSKSKSIYSRAKICVGRKYVLIGWSWVEQDLQDSSNTSTFLIFSAGSSCILEHQHDPLLFLK